MTSPDPFILQSEVVDIGSEERCNCFFWRFDNRLSGDIEARIEKNRRTFAELIYFETQIVEEGVSL